MRILQVNDFYVKGGAEMVMRQLGRALTLRGHEVHYAVGDDSGANDGRVHRTGHFRGLPSLLLRRLLYFNSDPLAYRHFEMLVRRINPDVIHCHNVASCLSPAIIRLAVKTRIPLVVSVHDYWPVCLNRTQVKGSERKPQEGDCDETGWNNCGRFCKWSTIRKWPGIPQGMLSLMKLLTDKDVKIVAVSNHVKSVLERFKYPPGSIDVVYNGIDIALFKPKKRLPAPVVLFLGGGNWRLKGLAHFYHIAKEISSHRPDAKFVALGGKVPNLGPAVENPGNVTMQDLVDFYQKAVCVCMPSLWPEPFPMVALESMACGVPVVAYASGGLTECIRDGETGFTVERSNLDEMSRKISWLLDNPEYARVLGSRGRRLVESNYRLEKMCDQYEQIFSRLKTRESQPLAV